MHGKLHKLVSSSVRDHILYYRVYSHIELIILIPNLKSVNNESYHKEALTR